MNLPDRTKTDMPRSDRVPQHCSEASWSLGVTSYGRPQLTKEDEHVLTSGPVSDFLSTHLRGPRTEASISDIHIHVIEDTCPPAPKPFFAVEGRKHALKRSTRKPLHSDRREKMAQGQEQHAREKRFYICRVLQMGPAVGARGVMGATTRRPKTGVLNTLALSSRLCRGPTAIEPEVALMMANLAKVRAGSLVLDPFCGSCSLLLPAATLGARTWGADIAGPAVAASVLQRTGGGAVGKGAPAHGNGQHGRVELEKLCDASQDSLEDLYEDFRRLSLLAPKLAMADIGDEQSPIRQSEFFDAIITDPPYNVKERVRADNNQPSNNTMFVLDDAETPVALSSTADVAADHPLKPKDEINLRVFERKREEDCPSRTSGQLSKMPTREAGEGAAVVGRANGLVGGVILSLLSLARDALKPGGRLIFFLPLRGQEARLDRLPTAVIQKLENCEQESALSQGERREQHHEYDHQSRLRLVYASKQRFTSQNMCRWLVLLEKERTPLGMSANQ